MENGILGGLLGGLLVGAMPGIQRKGSHVSVGVRQHRPRFVLYLGWGIFLVGLIIFPIFSDIAYGFKIDHHIASFIMICPFGLVPIINYYMFYIGWDTGRNRPEEQESEGQEAAGAEHHEES